MTHLHQHFTMSVCDNGTEALSDVLVVTDDDNNEPVTACGMETAV